MQVTKVFPVAVLHHTGGGLHDRVAQAAGSGNVKGFRQALHYRGVVGFLHVPEPGVFASPDPVGVGNVMDVLDIGPAAGSLAD